MPPLAAAGYHVIAPDQRGYGRTAGWDDSYDADPDQFRILNMVRDAVGSRLCARLPLGRGGRRARCRRAGGVMERADPARRLPLGRDHELAVRRRAVAAVQHRQRRRAAASAGRTTTNSMPSSRSSIRRASTIRTISASAGANEDMLHAPQGLHAFFRAYYHYKSADWKGNKPFPLKARTAEEMAKIPTYYVMDLDKGMAETAASAMPSAAEIAACKWLTEAEVDVYATEYGRTGFNGALQGYRVRRGSDPQEHRRDADLLGPHHRRAVHASSPARATGASTRPRARWRRCATKACTRMVGFHSARRRRPLGAAGAARAGEQAAARVFAEDEEGLREVRQPACLIDGHGRACPGHPDHVAQPCLVNRGRRDKPGDDAR